MTTKPPFFSLITVTRNNLNGLHHTRASIHTQHCTDFEWIIIDGASTDGTRNFLPTCHAKTVSEEDHGIYDAMNKGLEYATGEYVLFPNAGDEWATSHTLQRVMNHAHAHGMPDFIYGDALESLPGGALAYKAARDARHAHCGMITHHQAMVYRRAAIGDLRFNPAFPIAGDFDFTARFLRQTRSTLFCPFPVCVFEGGGVSQRHAWQGRCEQFRARALHGMNIGENMIIFAGQCAAWTLRRLIPALYWPLKARA